MMGSVFRGTQNVYAAWLAFRREMLAYVDARRHLFARIAAPSFAIAIGLVWFSPVLTSHFADADSYYAHASVIPQFDHIGAAKAYRVLADGYDQMQGGWFPIGSLPLAAWLVDSHFPLAKDLQYLFVVATLAVFGALAQRLLRSAPAGVFAVVACIAAWQFRMPHDPVIGTSLVTSWAALLTLGAYWALAHYIDTDSGRSFAGALLLLVAAMLCGPIPWALCFAMAIGSIALCGRTGIWIGLAAIVTTVGIFAGGHPSAPWKHPGNYAMNVLNQLIAALPTSYRAAGNLEIGHVPSLYHNGVRYIDDRFITVPAPSRLAWLGVFCGTAASYFTTLGLRRTSRTTYTIPVVVGLIFWVVPALLLGPNGMWRSGLPLGQSFEGVYFQYFGIGLLAAVFVGSVVTRQASRTLTAALVSLAVFVASYGNVRADAAALSKSIRADYSRSVIERAGAAGFFEEFDDGTTFGILRTLEPAAMQVFRVSDPRLLLYHYSKRRFNVVYADTRKAATSGATWLLEARLNPAMPLAAYHTVSTSGSARADRAFGFTPFPFVADDAESPRRGVREFATALRDGYAIFAERECGAVPISDAFAQSAPTLEYGTGFFRSGPVGYTVSAQEVTALGEISTDPNQFPKTFMESKGSIRLYRSSCPRGFLNFRAVAVSRTPSMMTIETPTRTEHIRLTNRGAHFWLRFDMRKTASPIRLLFWTSAPKAPKFDRIMFHYEKDVPRDIRIVFEPEGIWEDDAPAESR